MTRRLLGPLVLFVLLIPAAPARAGGTWLEFDRDAYAPGETARAQALVGHGQLGWVHDGPFYAYLAESHQVPSEVGIPLGNLVLEEQSPTTVLVTLEFRVPDVAAGEYAVIYCNDPCTEGLGDLIGGSLTVVASGTLPETGLSGTALLALGWTLVVLGGLAVRWTGSRGRARQNPNPHTPVRPLG